MKILLIEDERELSNNIGTYLASDHYLCEQAFTFDEALEKIDLYSYDCILLDLNLPGGDGLKILEEIKARKIDSGIIIISARGALDDKIKGLQIGADDYLAKPFSLSELSVRIYALMRRQQFSHNNTLTSNGVTINLLAKTVNIGNIEIILTKSEYELLLFLIGNKNKVISKNAIAEHLSGDMADMLDSHNFVYAHIKNLKSKLNDAGGEGCIKTVYGTGYKWEDKDA
ncbi:response regulator transcription factor [Macellibacteroides fermentans]|uniref:DNA-binding response regulator, OmpR family, contains REC and winged-helix (WHTH) domain n=1 Tax=Parabacteroides chartae TaxID=1037355 RepID=A0A1T5DR31_9BACT|nr:response regulator transcription factor [Parabacteroides chartae]SKB74192.1 DNA-binding response regulator, OmpR family, contains REC and winged-helix (wHTH) domain [Parabacteroides chartae]